MHESAPVDCEDISILSHIAPKTLGERLKRCCLSPSIPYADVPIIIGLSFVLRWTGDSLVGWKSLTKRGWNGNGI